MIPAKVAGRLARHAGLRLFRLFSRPLELRRSAAPSGLGLRRLSEFEVLDLCRDPKLDLRRDAVAAAYARGDLCIAAFDAGAVAGYCWLAFAPLPHLDGVWVDFDRRVAWTYKSLVLPSYRGKGIAPALYAFSDADSQERGCGDSVICVESHNRPSIGAALRAGYAPSGYGGYLLRGSRLRAWSSPAARAHGVAFFLPGRESAK
jgi:GNAT superfamily N-acetyltransferase